MRFSARNLQILAEGMELTGITQGIFESKRMLLECLRLQAKNALCSDRQGFRSRRQGIARTKANKRSALYSLTSGLLGRDHLPGFVDVSS